jgi:hypothetical protein
LKLDLSHHDVYTIGHSRCNLKNLKISQKAVYHQQYVTRKTTRTRAGSPQAREGLEKKRPAPAEDGPGLGEGREEDERRGSGVGRGREGRRPGRDESGARKKARYPGYA